MPGHDGACSRLKAAVERLEALDDPAIFTRLYIDEARGEAAASDIRSRAGFGRGPLEGVIVSVKDLFDVAGDVTTAGSAILQGTPPAAVDATVVHRLREAGAVILGKTNMTEFAYSGLGLNPHWGTPGNARAPDRVPGGSSSGAAVSVAAGIVDLAIGSDTGGSVRIPASLNGCVGFKPTASRLPMTGVFPLSPSLDSVGPLAADVQTCADADAVMAGGKPFALAPESLNGLRIGVVEEALAETESAIVRAFEQVLAALRKAGAILARAPLDDLLSRRSEVLREASIVAVEATRIHAQRILDHPDRFDPNVWVRLQNGKVIAAPAYERSQFRRRELAGMMDDELRAYRCVVLPTTSMVAPLTSEVLRPEDFHPINDRMLKLPGIANFFDLCAISLPMPILPLPAGISLFGRHNHDRSLFSMAKSLEDILS